MEFFFQDLTSCSPVESYQRFGDTFCIVKRSGGSFILSCYVGISLEELTKATNIGILTEIRTRDLSGYEAEFLTTPYPTLKFCY
jgi:hypothetical protein